MYMMRSLLLFASLIAANGNNHFSIGLEGDGEIPKEQMKMMSMQEVGNALLHRAKHRLRGKNFTVIVEQVGKNNEKVIKKYNEKYEQKYTWSKLWGNPHLIRTMKELMEKFDQYIPKDKQIWIINGKKILGSTYGSKIGDSSLTIDKIGIEVGSTITLSEKRSFTVKVIRDGKPTLATEVEYEQKNGEIKTIEELEKEFDQYIRVHKQVWKINGKWDTFADIRSKLGMTNDADIPIMVGSTIELRERDFFTVTVIGAGTPPKNIDVEVKFEQGNGKIKTMKQLEGELYNHIPISKQMWTIDEKTWDTYQQRHSNEEPWRETVAEIGINVGSKIQLRERDFFTVTVIDDESSRDGKKIEVKYKQENGEIKTIQQLEEEFVQYVPGIPTDKEMWIINGETWDTWQGEWREFHHSLNNPSQHHSDEKREIMNVPDIDVADIDSMVVSKMSRKISRKMRADKKKGKGLDPFELGQQRSKALHDAFVKKHGLAKD
jgi:hypothetical protein